MGAVVAWRFWGFCVLHATSGFKAACPSAGVLLQMLESPRRRSCRVDGPGEGPWHAVPAAPPSPKLGSSHDYCVSYKQPYYVKHFPLLPPEKACRTHERRGEQVTTNEAGAWVFAPQSWRRWRARRQRGSARRTICPWGPPWRRRSRGLRAFWAGDGRSYSCNHAYSTLLVIWRDQRSFSLKKKIK